MSERERSAVKVMPSAAVKGAQPTTKILVLDEEAGNEHLAAVIDALAAAGYQVDTHVPAHRQGGGLVPVEALRYDVVVMRPEASSLSSPSRESSTLGDVEIGRLRIDTQRRMIFVDGVAVRMSAREFTLLHHLASYPGIVFSREALLRAVWGSSWRTEGSVTEYVRRVRMLLGPSGIGECIVTRKGFGYSFDPDAVA